jgi:hypothetical protein
MEAQPLILALHVFLISTAVFFVQANSTGFTPILRRVSRTRMF